MRWEIPSGFIHESMVLCAENKCVATLSGTSFSNCQEVGYSWAYSSTIFTLDIYCHPRFSNGSDTTRRITCSPIVTIGRAIENYLHDILQPAPMPNCCEWDGKIFPSSVLVNHMDAGTSHNSSIDAVIQNDLLLLYAASCHGFTCLSCWTALCRWFYIVPLTSCRSKTAQTREAG